MSINNIQVNSNVAEVQNNNQSSSINKDMFLKILAQSIKNQDPSNPKDSEEYISQFVQFASLEQMMNLNNSMSNMVNNSEISVINTSMMMATSTIGKSVEFVDEQDKTYTGIVKNVFIKDGQIFMNILSEDTNEINAFPYGNLVKVCDSNQ